MAEGAGAWCEQSVCAGETSDKTAECRHVRDAVQAAWLKP